MLSHLPRAHDIDPREVSVELVISPWPLILWVIFRTVAKDRTDPLHAFLSILRGPDHDLFTWDSVDHSDLSERMRLWNDGQLGLYPLAWNQYMVEIDSKTWIEITDMTQSAKRLRFEPDDLKIRLGTASLLFSTTLSIPQNILAPLHITLDEFPFTIMAHVGDPDHQKHPASGNFECKEFWARSNLENWLLARSQDLCHALWHTSSDMTTLERVQSMYLILNGSPEVSMFIVSAICTDLLSLRAELFADVYILSRSEAICPPGYVCHSQLR
jgi:hypothetical protein